MYSCSTEPGNEEIFLIFGPIFEKNIMILLARVLDISGLIVDFSPAPEML
jgi:hypothetical protein